MIVFRNQQLDFDTPGNSLLSNCWNSIHPPKGRFHHEWSDHCPWLPHKFSTSMLTYIYIYNYLYGFVWKRQVLQIQRLNPHRKSHSKHTGNWMPQTYNDWVFCAWTIHIFCGDLGFTTGGMVNMAGFTSLLFNGNFRILKWRYVSTI
jgi:hypothetical protein